MIEPNNIGLFIGAIPIGLAFSKKVRSQIYNRARGRSELSGSNAEPLEASHIDHTRDENYDTPENGELLTQTEHLAYHIRFSGQSEKIGLSEEANEWAISRLFERVFEFARKRGIPEYYVQARIQQTIEMQEAEDE